MAAAAHAVEGAVVHCAALVVAAHDAAYVGVVVLDVARDTAVLYSAAVLASDAAHFCIVCRRTVVPSGTDIGAHPAVIDEPVVLTGDAADESRFATVDVAGNVEIPNPSCFANLCKQTLVVGFGILDVNADGVTVTIEKIGEWS